MGKKNKREVRRYYRRIKGMNPWMVREMLVSALQSIADDPSLDKKGKKRRCFIRAIEMIDAQNPYAAPNAPWGAAVRPKPIRH